MNREEFSIDTQKGEFGCQVIDEDIGQELRCTNVKTDRVLRITNAGVITVETGYGEVTEEFGRRARIETDHDITVSSRRQHGPRRWKHEAVVYGEED